MYDTKLFLIFLFMFGSIAGSVQKCNERYKGNNHILDRLIQEQGGDITHKSFEKKITLLTRVVPNPDPHQYTGHFGVTRSINNGFRKLNVSFNYNPLLIDEVGDIVMVLADVNALQQAIAWKRSGRIKKLLAGPNLVVHSFENERILASPEIDVVIVPCWWVKTAYIEEEPRLKGRIKIWYAGVGVTKWISVKQSLVNQTGNRQVLIYWKREPEELMQQVKSLLYTYGWQPLVIEYGTYTLSEFQRFLQHSSFAIFLSKSESQGLALAECWSSNVPTLVFDRTMMFDLGRSYSDVSACPYICNQTGLAWYTLADLEECLQLIKKKEVSFAPHEWMVNNMSDECSARLLLHIIASL
ncbi:MAG: hypothetical protein WA432_04545 [Candidatus Babeliaceae bacterium]